MQSINKLRQTMKPFKAARSYSVSVSASKASVIRGIQHNLRTKQQSAVEITQQYLDTISRCEKTINSFITVDADQALKQVCGARLLMLLGITCHQHNNTCASGLLQAKEVDEHIAKGVKLASLAGVPIAVKVRQLMVMYGTSTQTE